MHICMYVRMCIYVCIYIYIYVYMYYTCRATLNGIRTVFCTPSMLCSPIVLRNPRMQFRACFPELPIVANLVVHKAAYV